MKEQGYYISLWIKNQVDKKKFLIFSKNFLKNC